MTRRLGGYGRRGFPALASLSLVSALACGAVITGCGGDDNGGGGGGNTSDDGGDAGDANSTTGTDSGPAKDAGIDAAHTADAGEDSGSTGVDSGSTVEDSGVVETPDSGVDSGGEIVVVDSGTSIKDSGVDSSTSEGTVDSGIDSGHITDSGSGGSTADANDGATGPTASFSTATVPLGAGNCGGAAVTATYTIANTGGSTLNISNAAVTGGVFSVTPTTLAIAPGQSGHLTVSASVPQNSVAGTLAQSNLTFTTNDTTHASGTVPLTVLPTGVTLAWANTSPTTASFGLQPEGANATPIGLSLTNTGNASVTVGFGAVAAPFTLTPSTSGALVGGASVPLTADFDPTDTTQHTATSTFTLPAGTAVCGTSVGSLALSGTGGSGSLTGWATAFDFGATACGTAPASTSFTLNNTGALDAHITTVTANGATTFTTDAAVGSTIPTGGSLVVHISGPAIPATPSSINAVYSGSLSFTTDAFDDTTAHVVNLTEEPSGAILSFDTEGNNNFGNFGSEAATTSSTPVAFNVVNTGNAPAAVTLGIAGNTGNAFAVSTPSFSVLNGTPQGESATFTPPTFGTFGGTLGLTTTSTLCAPPPAGIALSGTGNAGTIAVSTQSIPFLTACGSIATPQTFTVTNNGNEPINWSASLAAGAGSVYTISVNATNGGVTANPFTVGNLSLGAGDFDTVTVSPLPVPQYPANASPSAFADTVTVTTTNVPGANPSTVALSETPLGDIIQWTATGFTFPSQPVSTNSAGQTFTITNAANPGSPSANIAIQKSGDAPADFILSGTSATLAAGVTSSPFSVAFDAPAVADEYDANVVLATDDNLCAALPTSVTLNGTAVVAGPEYSQTSLNFGNVNCGSAGGAQTIQVSNTGGNPFNITGLSLAVGTYFSVTSNVALPAAVPAFSTNAVTITLTPVAIPSLVNSVPDVGTYSDQLTITTDADIAEPTQAVPLAMGAKGVIIANPLVSTTWNFGQVPFGSTADYNIPINNTGNANAVATLTTTQTTYYGLASSIVEPGNGLLTATFTPPSTAATWPDQGTLTITPAEGQVFCQPLPASWGTPTAGIGVSLTGTETNNSVTSVSPQSLPFPAANCGGPSPGSPPAGEPVTIFNSANASVGFTAQLLNGTYYLLDTPSGNVPANGHVALTVTPGNLLNIGQNQGGNTGSAPYSDTLRIDITGGAATTYFVPITMTVNGVVLTLVPQGGNGQVEGYDFSCNQENTFTVQAQTGFDNIGAIIQNTGNVAGNVTANAAGFGGPFFAYAGSGNLNAGAESTFQFAVEGELPAGCEPGIPVPGNATFNAPNMCAAALSITISTNETGP